MSKELFPEIAPERKTALRSELNRIYQILAITQTHPLLAATSLENYLDLFNPLEREFLEFLLELRWANGC